MKVQVIGLPGAGKTTAIGMFLKERPDVTYLDIAKTAGWGREERLELRGLLNPGPLIVESACGIVLSDSIVLELKPPLHQVFERLAARGEVVDPDYLSLLGSLMVPSHCIIHSPEELFHKLRQLGM